MGTLPLADSAKEHTATKFCFVVSPVIATDQKI